MKKIENNESYFEESFTKLTSQSLIISNTEFEECEFIDCDFSSTTFEKCKFLNCSFTRCNLSLIKVPYTRIFEVEFLDTKLVGIDWTRANWPSYHMDSGLKFQRCILNDSSFFALTLHEMIMGECKLHEVDFREGDFSHSVMTHSDFTNSQFMRTNLQYVDFSESVNIIVNVLNNTLTKAKFNRFEALNLLENLDIELVD